MSKPPSDVRQLAGELSRALGVQVSLAALRGDRAGAAKWLEAWNALAPGLESVQLLAPTPEAVEEVSAPPPAAETPEPSESSEPLAPAEVDAPPQPAESETPPEPPAPAPTRGYAAEDLEANHAVLADDPAPARSLPKIEESNGLPIATTPLRLGPKIVSRADSEEDLSGPPVLESELAELQKEFDSLAADSKHPYLLLGLYWRVRTKFRHLNKSQKKSWRSFKGKIEAALDKAKIPTPFRNDEGITRELDLERFSQAYSCFDSVQAAVEHLELHRDDLDAKTFESILKHAAAAESLVFRARMDADKKPDAAALAMHKRLEAIQPANVYVTYWNRSPGNEVPWNDALEAARKLPTLLKKSQDALLRTSEKTEREAGKAAALARLEEFLNGSRVEDFEVRLQQEVAAVLDAQVPESDKKLRSLLEGMGHFIPNETHKKARNLRAKLIDDASAHAALDSKSEVETPDPIVQQAREIVAGKRMVFIGGNKGQGYRQSIYKEALGLDAFDWPDAEPTDGPTDLCKHLKNNDIAVQIIKYSRHSYKIVIDHAKELGMQTVILTGGYSLNQLAHAIVNQLGGSNGDAASNGLEKVASS